MNSREISDYILEGIANDFTEIVVLAEQRAPKPTTMPYGSLKVTVPYVAERGMDIVNSEKVASPGAFDYDVQYTNVQIPEMTISISTYGDSESNSSELAYKLHDWFESIGINYLDNNNIAVIDVMDIADRTIVIQGDYEFRFGFDVILRYTRTIERVIETIETVELD